MAEWLWLVGVALAITLVQILLYHRMRDQPSDDRSEHPDRLFASGDRDGHNRRASERLAPREADDRSATTGDAQDGRRCPSCGAVNAADESFTYCHNCVQPLA